MVTSLGSEALPARLFKALPKLREALLAAAEEGRVVGPAEATEATDGAVLARGLPKALEVISADCARRGEPDLAALVVREAALADGTDTGGGARRRAWMHFGGQPAVDAGADDEQAAADRVTRSAGAPRPAAAPRAPAAAHAGSSAPAPRAPRATASRKAVPPPPTPLDLCPECFTVRSASGTCMCV